MPSRTSRAPTLVVPAGRDKALARHHPWIFPGAVAQLHGEAAAGDTVVVRSAAGKFLAHASWHPDAHIRARVWSFDEADTIDDAFFARRIARAAERRRALAPATDACRLVFGESDGLAGVVADRYGAVVVCQLLTAGAQRWRAPIAAALAALDGVETVLERSESDNLAREGVEARRGVLHGPERSTVTIREAAWRFEVDLAAGHKTGFYLDQRDARRAVESLAADRRVLNVFGYTGSFSVAALSGGASSVSTVDSSAPALRLAAANCSLNGFAPPPASFVTADAFSHLRRLRSGDERFGLIIVDPPKLAAHQGQVARASRAYKDANLQACHLLEDGGRLVTFSCSAAIGPELFQKIVFGAASDAGRELQIVGRLDQPSDHPVLLSFPESHYLCGLVCEAV